MQNITVRSRKQLYWKENKIYSNGVKDWNRIVFMNTQKSPANFKNLGGGGGDAQTLILYIIVITIKILLIKWKSVGHVLWNLLSSTQNQVYRPLRAIYFPAHRLQTRRWFIYLYWYIVIKQPYFNTKFGGGAVATPSLVLLSIVHHKTWSITIHKPQCHTKKKLKLDIQLQYYGNLNFWNI